MVHRGGFLWRSRDRRKPNFYSRDYRSGRRFQRRSWGRQKRATTIWKRKDEIISIFIDNINVMTIRSLFEVFGEVTDVFISQKKRASNNYRFGFVKMRGPRNAYRAIYQMKGRWVDDSKIYVKEASFKQKESRSGKANVDHQRNITPGKGIHKRVDNIGHNVGESQDSMETIGKEKFVKVNVNSDIMEELVRSLIGECDEPRSVEVLSQMLTNQWSSITKADQVKYSADGGYCYYPETPAKALGIVAAILLLIEQIVISVGAGCFCCSRHPCPSDCPGICSIICFVFSWLFFVVAFSMLITAVVLNNSNYLVKNYSTDSNPCPVLMPGFYAGAAVICLFSVALSFISYFVLMGSRNKGARQLANNNGMAMGQHQLPK